MVQQLVGFGAIARRDRDSYARADDGLMILQVEGSSDRAADSLGQRPRIQRRIVGDLYDRKLVAAQPRDHVVFPHAVAQASSNQLQQIIAHRMPKRVVDPLQAVEVEIKQREAFPAPRALDPLFDSLAEHHPVGQAGERIVMGEMRDMSLDTPLLGGVPGDVDKAACSVRPHLGDGQLHGKFGAVLVLSGDLARGDGVGR